MATFNTAFGSLPSTRDLMGGNNTTAGGAQQTKARRQGQQQDAGQEKTFADMQKAGQARPAPPGARPAQQAMPSESQPQMLNDLRSRLGEEQPQEAPQLGGQATNVEAKSRLNQQGGLENDLRQKQASAQMPGPPQPQDQQQAMAQAEMSAVRQQQGQTQGQAQGYDTAQFNAIRQMQGQAQGQSQAQMQDAYSKFQASSEPAVNRTPEQDADLMAKTRQVREPGPAQGGEDAGISDRLRALLDRGQQDQEPAPETQQATRAPFLDQVGTQLGIPPVAATAPAPTVPTAPAATGTAPAAAATAPAPAAPQAEAGAPPAAQASAPAAAPQAAPAQAPAASAATPAGTPAGAPAQAAYKEFGGSQIGNTMMQQLQQQLQQMQGAPSRFDDPAYKASRDAALANMEAEAGAQRSKLEEEMASRGLASSSISGGRYGDLAGQQARARATMEADLLKEQAQTSAQDRQVLLSSMGDLAKTAGAQDLGAFQANIESMKASGQLDMAAKELMQRERLEGRSLDLQQARDKVAAELGRADIGFKYAGLAQEKGIEEGRLAETKALRLQNLGISNQELELKSTEIMGRDKTGKLTRQAADDQAQLEIKTKQLMQQDRSLDITEAQNKAQNLIDEARTKETGRANLAQEEGSKLDRDLRAKLGTDTKELEQARLGMGEKEFKLSLLKVIADGGLSDDEADSMYKRFGYEPPARAATTPAPAGSSAAYGNTNTGTGTGTGFQEEDNRIP